jgi:hypothetical protein
MENRFEQGRFVPGVQFTFRFETHEATTTNYDARKAEMANLFRTVFQKGQANYLFRENMYGTDSQESWYKKELRISKSFLRANVSTILKEMSGKNPTSWDIESNLSSVKNVRNLDPRTAYQLMVDEVLDEMADQGVLINPFFEKTSHLRRKYPQAPNDDPYDPRIFLLATEQQKADYIQESIERGIEFRKDRDEIIKKQLEGLQKLAARQDRPANILVLMGLLHSGLFEQMPFNIREISSASSERPLFDDPKLFQSFQANAGLPFNPHDFLRR